MSDDADRKRLFREACERIEATLEYLGTGVEAEAKNTSLAPAIFHLGRVQGILDCARAMVASVLPIYDESIDAMSQHQSHRASRPEKHNHN